MATTYTLALANAKPGSIVLTPSTSPANPSAVPRYWLNIKSADLQGSNPFLADGVTNNPNASVSLFSIEGENYFFKDIKLSEFTQIGGSATPATLVLTLAAIAALIAE